MSSLDRLDAMREAGVRISVIDLIRRFVVFENGIRAKIIGMYDEFDEETTDPEDVRYYEFAAKGLGWGFGQIDADETLGHPLH